MKQAIALLLSVCVALSLPVFSASTETKTSEDEDRALLSTMDNEECEEFLLSQGIPVPEEFSGIDLPRLFADLEQDPDMPVTLGWSALADFTEDVRSVVKRYYGIGTSSSIRSGDRALLSSLDNEECEEFLLSQGVSVPEEFNGIDLPRLFEDLEQDPDMSVALGWSALADFTEEVRSVVKRYYGIGTSSSTRGSTYTLQYSTLYSWNATTMPNYNCYAYAIGRTTLCHPGNFSNQSYIHLSSIDAVARLVKDDLNGGLGYNCVKVQSNLPTSTSGWANVIAVRKDTTFDYYGMNDYHFAKLSSSNWYHKPGGTAVLKFNNAPSNSVDWTNECYDGTYHAPTITYDSNLRYLMYKSNHGSTTYTWTGEHYHSGTRHYYLYAYVCNDCGDYVSTVWTSIPCSGACVTPWGHLLEPEDF